MYSEEIKTRKIELLRLMSRQMNGAVASSLRHLSSSKLLTYGVSVPAIKDIALLESGNTLLAECMYNSNVREMKLGAIFMLQPQNIDLDIAQMIGSAFGSHEVMLHGSTLLAKSNIRKELVELWLESDDILCCSAAAIILAAMARDGQGDDLYFADKIKRVNPDIDSGTQIRVLVAVARSSEVMKGLVKEICSELAASISEEVAWQIE